MARDEKRYELRPVEDEVVPEEVVMRLENDEISQRAKPVRIVVPQGPEPVSQRLDLPDREDYEMRTHQPSIDDLIEAEAANPDFLEQNWGAPTAAAPRQVPWGWFVLIGLILAGAVIWSLTGGKKAESKTATVQVAVANAIDEDAKEEKDASQLIERIEATAAKFFAASDVDSLVAVCRHPERVRPLMESYYAGKAVPPDRLTRSRILQPITLDKHANFWMKTAQVESGKTRNILIEILPNGEPKVDWETSVCYQPMDWDRFAKERPTSVALDFRVNVEPDNFYSHEFADSNQWICFRLTTLNSYESLFGYARAGSDVARDITDLMQKTRLRKGPMILRLSVPEGVKSRTGVVIEKLVSPRWLYLDEPDSGS